ncbi:WXG100 family type VII secretion target [Kitasatospora sp. NPDC085879]|jgi:WXG100 family type VII secretion target|uniref:WXG100 family type VII secretion target n=1 Tax=Kitasatospora sp. NPDC085879 TaxID=3154769 RepID=UPI000BB0F40A|nr:WXG100 family type VII secretion target [Streptomyces sp. TLI_235]PBC79776.1 WXG100 family type VII secretion target [Streptomyces sp. TLI_235]
MSEHILVNFSTISNASSEVRQTAQRIQSQLDELKAGVQRIASSWEGSAQEGYQARQHEWDAKAADLQQVLGQIATSLDSAAQSYQATEQKNAGVWS